ncbi:MAG: hypothetical protein AABX77_01535 [Nanoarchaeota archaeon]
MKIKKFLKDIKKQIINIIKFKIFLIIISLMIITIIYISFALYPKNHSIDQQPKLFLIYREYARQIVNYLDEDLLSFIDSEKINNQASLNYQATPSVNIKFNMGYNALVIRANGSVENYPFIS